MTKKIRQLFKYLAFGAGLFVFSVFILKAPELHRNIIRSYVGNKTVILRGENSGGTGFHVTTKSGETFIITNKHVCEIAYKRNGNRFLYAVTKDGRFLPRKVISISKDHDLCALSAVPGYTGLTVGSSLGVGDNIAIVGHPKLYPLSISRGEYIGNQIISLLSECQSGRIVPNFYKIDPELIDKINIMSEFIGGEKYCVLKIFAYQITAYSRGGSSGSPVVNFYGDVVGVLFAGNRADQFDSYMVPLFELQSFIENL